MTESMTQVVEHKLEAFSSIPIVWRKKNPENHKELKFGKMTRQKQNFLNKNNQQNMILLCSFILNNSGR
jgi:hypothetical protein